METVFSYYYPDGKPLKDWLSAELEMHLDTLRMMKNTYEMFTGPMDEGHLFLVEMKNVEDELKNREIP